MTTKARSGSSREWIHISGELSLWGIRKKLVDSGKPRKGLVMVITWSDLISRVPKRLDLTLINSSSGGFIGAALSIFLIRLY